jgi:hypothetical protein
MDRQPAEISRGDEPPRWRLSASPAFRRSLSIAYYLLFLIILTGVGRFLWSNVDVLNELRAVAPGWWLLAAMLYLATLVAKGISFDILAGVFGVQVRLKDSIALTSTGLLANYMLPGNTAVPLRSLYLKRVYGLSYTRFIPMALAAFVFSTGLYGVMAGLAALVIGPVPSSSYNAVILLFSGGGLALMLMLLFSPRYGWVPFVGHYIELALEGWRMLVSSHALFGRWLSVEFARAALEIAFFLTTVRMLGIDMSPWQALIITLAKECSVFLRLTPGAFGISEGVQAFFAFCFGLDVARVVLAGLTGRVLEILCLAPISGLLVRGLYARISQGPAHA